MTDLRSALEKYRSMRKGLGYKYEHQTRRLGDFIAFMGKRKAETITTKLAMEWATLPPDRHASWALRLTDVRGFARHVANFDPRTEVPRWRPAWMEACQALRLQRRSNQCPAGGGAGPAARGRTAAMDHTLFGLIAVTGMRLSEAMGLERDDVDLDTGVLTVRLTKFGKSRLVPLHPTTSAVLRNYADRRCASRTTRQLDLLRRRARGPPVAPVRPPRLLASVPRDRTAAPWRSYWATRARLPTPLRHPDAARLASRSKNVEQQLPALSTYLGHACVRDTYWYLSACPELMEEAARRLDRRWEATP